MFLKSYNKKRLGPGISPWFVIAGASFLLVAVVILGYRNYNRESQYTSQILGEKGNAILKAIEASSRTGMMSMMWSDSQLQVLVEETGRLPGVFYIFIVDKAGKVLAHSDSDMVGTHINDSAQLETIAASQQSNWKIVKRENHQRALEVIRTFDPTGMHSGRQSGHMDHMDSKKGYSDHYQNKWWMADESDENKKFILVGLNLQPFEEAISEDIRNSAVISSVIVILGFAGFLSMYWLQRYRAARRSLQDTSALAQEVVTNLPVGVIVADKNHKIAFCNSVAEEIIGLAIADVLGRDPESVLPSSLRKFFAASELNKSIQEVELECEFQTGRIVPVSVSASSIVNEEGQFVGQVLIMRDLGEVRRLQEEIRRKEKLAALGGLAAGVAHEIRNPLSSIKGIASYFRAKFDEESDDKEAAGVMIREVDRLNRVITELLDFARPPQINRRMVNLNDLINHSLRLLYQEALSKKVSIDFHNSESPIMIQVDPDRLSQCLLNLCLNALQAMTNGGRLAIAAFCAEDSRIRIDVKDTGHGIRPEHMGMIFNPYFTTKTKGTGLGLAIVYKIVEAHGGFISVRSNPGKETVFSITLPQRST